MLQGSKNMMERASPFSFSDRLYVLILRKRGERGRESSEIERKNRREPVKLKGFEVGKMMVLNYTLCVGCNFAQKRNITKQFYYLRKETLFFHNIFHRAKLWQIATCLWLVLVWLLTRGCCLRRNSTTST